MIEVECPYCGYNIEVDGEGVNFDNTNEQECFECEKSFVYTTTISVDCYAKKAPCLNGEVEHEFKKVCGSPSELFEGIEACKICGRERVDVEVNRAARKRYMEQLNSDGNKKLIKLLNEGVE